MDHTVDTYISGFEDVVQEKLRQIRLVILDAAPTAEERFAYGMPAYKANGKPLVYFAAFKHHIGFYAMPTGHAAFARELSIYKQGKGSVQFPLDKDIPYELIHKIVAFRLAENESKRKA